MMLDAETHMDFVSCSELVLRTRHLNLMSTLKLPRDSVPLLSEN